MPGGAHEHMKAWEPEEDHIIMQMVQNEGPKWKLIVKQLPGRTVSSVRNRWQRIEKGRKLREDGVDLKNRCHACGQPKRGHICTAKMRGGPQMDLPTPPPGLGGGLMLGSGGLQPAPLLNDALFTAPPSRPTPTSMHISQPALKRTRSGSRLVPVDGAGPSSASGNVVHGHEAGSSFAAGYPAMPSLQRTNTSFFKDLAMATDLFSPDSRQMFEAWADSPADPSASGGTLMSAVANDVAAPPSLRRVASRTIDDGGAEPPKMTRSVVSFLNGLAEDIPAPAAPSGSAELSRQSSNPMPNLGHRSVTSFMKDFIDESAALDMAPPANAVPPLRHGMSLEDLNLDIGPISAAPPSLSAQLSLDGGSRRMSPRMSPRLGSPRFS